MNQGVPAPARPPGPRVEAAHRTERCIDADIVRDRRTDNDHAAAHDRRRGDLEFAGPDQLLSDVEPDLPIGAEIATGNAGPGVERDDAGFVGAHENPAVAGGAFGRLVVDPVSHATADVTVARTLTGIELRIVAPLLRAAAGIERDHLVERCT